jgi:hypothetical protein
MPTGIDNPVIGYIGFCAVKFAGYTIAARFISRSYERKGRSEYAIGGVRTLIGMAAGVAYFNLWRLIPGTAAASGFGYMGGLVPVRFGEWWLLVWIFYDRELRQARKNWCTVALATIWSYVLDVPALVGFLVTGGVWVC